MAQFLMDNFDGYILQVVAGIGIAMIMVLGLNLITGVTGQLTLGHAAFMGLGAYAAALVTQEWNVSLELSILAGGAVAGVIGFLLGIPVLRLTGDYLAVVTLGFGEVVRVVFLNIGFTGGALGMFGFSSYDQGTMLYYVILVLGLVLYMMIRLERGRFGRALRAIREDEIAAEAMGIHASRYKVQAFAIGSMCAGLGGALFAHLVQGLMPGDFGFASMKSIDYLDMAVLGGLGSIPGALLGAGLLGAAPELLREAAQYRMLLYGVILIILMIFRPNGLLGGVDFRVLMSRTIRLRTAKNKPTKTGVDQ